VGITFTSEEIFDIAVQIERNGAAFYRQAAKMFSGDSGNMLLELAAMEDDHEKTFIALRDEVLSGYDGETAFDPDNEAGFYLQAVADGKVFDVNEDPADHLPPGTSLGEVLDYAIGIEKESVVFYTGIKELVPGNQGKNRIDLIIREEIGHITTLRNKKSELSA